MHKMLKRPQRECSLDWVPWKQIGDRKLHAKVLLSVFPHKNLSKGETDP